MQSEIVIVREDQGYRVLFGHLRLAGILGMAGEACIDVKGEGKIKIIKTSGGLIVKRKNRHIPFLSR